MARSRRPWSSRCPARSGAPKLTPIDFALSCGRCRRPVRARAARRPPPRPPACGWGCTLRGRRASAWLARRRSRRAYHFASTPSSGSAGARPLRRDAHAQSAHPVARLHRGTPSGWPKSPSEARDRAAWRTAASPRPQPPDTMRPRISGEARKSRAGCREEQVHRRHHTNTSGVFACRAARRDDGAGAQALERRDVRRVRECLRPPEGGPVPHAHRDGFCGLHARGPGGPFRRQQPLSVAATGGWRMAGMRMMIDDDLRLRAFGLQVLGWDLCAVATRSTGPKTCTRTCRYLFPWTAFAGGVPVDGWRAETSQIATLGPATKI